MKRRKTVALVVSTVVAYTLAFIGSRGDPFVGSAQPSTLLSTAMHGGMPKEDIPHSRSPYFKTDFFGGAPHSASVHVGSIAELGDGTLAVVWYGGTREGAADVSVYLATLPPTQDDWSAPKVVASRNMARAELSRHIRKVGNPLIFSGSNNSLHLLYVSIAVGGWSGSSLNLATSDDKGNTWGAPRRLTLSPFLNVSELVKGRPLQLSSLGNAGTAHAETQFFAVPIYHECIAKFPEILWLAIPADGKPTWRKTRMAGGRSFIQPEIVDLGNGRLRAFYRRCGFVSKIGTATSDNAGRTWTAPGYLNLPNPNSGLAAVTLPDGRILLAFNDSVSGRNNLRLAVSDDAGKTFKRVCSLDEQTVEEKSGSGFSYPYMILGRGGIVHLVYTYHRRRIKRVSFNSAWIDQQIVSAAK